ncbi:MAG: RIP metalloprotease RseP [Verrucomicrobia bacterium]|jgi:regulator of sigma E protease|nr:RIP metalloprotease RseP [Verrucomicrobiota bacterium]
MLLRILSDPFAILLVVLFFGASIFVHEWGHYLAARWRGLRIERFSIGFGPKLFGWKDKRGVDWRVSLFPLGGYVALPQMADMRGIEGENEAPREALPRLSYTDKMTVAGAGALFNILFALLLGTVLWVTGLPVSAQSESTTIGYTVDSMTDAEGMERQGPAVRAGLQPGDVIVAVDGEEVSDWEDIVYAVTTGTGRSSNGNPKTELTIRRDGERREVTLFPVLDEHEGIRRIGIAPANPLKVGAVMEHSPAEDAGLQAGDRILAANGEPLYHTSALSELIRENPDSALKLAVQRGEEKRSVSVQPEEVVYTEGGDKTPMIGVRWEQVTSLRHIDPFTQVADAFTLTLNVLGALVHPRSDIGISNLSGPVGIGYTLYVISQIGILEVLSIVVLINVNLAILNLLPIPVLDGGHMAFATVERLRGRPVSPRIIASAQGAFMLFFLAVFVYVTFFDVGRVARNESAISEAEEAAQQRVPIEFSED